MTKQQDIGIIGSISISVMAQWKMALHATSKPLRGGDAAGSSGSGGPTIHGIVLGHREKSTTTTASATNDSKASLVVTDVVPVCRETPTKPMVDMALRLVEAHLMHKQQQQQSQLKEETKIIGWYTNSSIRNNVGDDINEDEEDDDALPNASACRILSSMAESSSCDADDHHGPFVLLSMSNSKLSTFMMNEKNNNATSSQMVICNAFQWDTKSRSLAKRNNVLVVNTTDGGHKQLRLPTEVVFDFVDHMNDCDFVDSKWIENN